jgi:hypothetical protein
VRQPARCPWLVRHDESARGVLWGLGATGLRACRPG